MQEAELKDLRADMPEYAAIHAHVLQAVLARLDKTYQAFFRRLMAGEKAGVRDAGCWHAHLLAWLVSQGRTGAENGATAGEPPQEGEQPQA